MSISILLVIAALTSLVAANADPYTFNITSLYTKEPNGMPDGNTDYYTIEFGVTSSLGNNPESAFCWTSWADGTTSSGYAEYVPMSQWIPCAHNSSKLADKTSEFFFQLYSDFTISNFSLALLQNFSETTNDSFSQNLATTTPAHILTSPTFPCTITLINSTNSSTLHTSGTCSTPQNFTGLTLPIANVTPSTPETCTPSPLTTLYFGALETTAWGDAIWLVGNISELGNWDPGHAVGLNAAAYSEAEPLWNGGAVQVPAGTPFEWKYIQWDADGSLRWECGENRVAVVEGESCVGVQEVGNNPDYFRCGDH